TEPPTIVHLDRLAQSGVHLDDAQLRQFDRYSSLLRERNEVVNLTAIVDPAEIATKHFLDSLTLLLVRTPAPAARLIDVGTGAGFPGVPLAIARGDVRVTLVESVGKKVRFLEELIVALELANVTIIQARAEDLARDPAHRERHDVAVVRALPVLATNLELLLPFCRVGGDAVRALDTLDDDPIDLARGLVAAGARGLHVVDLDGARTGEYRNVPLAAAIARAVDVPVQLGGSVCDPDVATDALRRGIARVVFGSATLGAPDRLPAVAALGARALLALEVEADRIRPRGGDVMLAESVQGGDAVGLARV